MKEGQKVTVQAHEATVVGQWNSNMVTVMDSDSRHSHIQEKYLTPLPPYVSGRLYMSNDDKRYAYTSASQSPLPVQGPGWYRQGIWYAYDQPERPMRELGSLVNE